MTVEKKTRVSKRGRPAKTKAQLVEKRNTPPKVDITDFTMAVKQLYCPQITKIINFLIYKEFAEAYQTIPTPDYNAIEQSFHKYFKHAFTKSTMSIFHLKYYADLFVASVFSIYENSLKENFIDEETESFISFDGEEKAEITNVIVSMYLEQWLKKCPELRHTILSFAEYPYCFNSEIEAVNENHTVEDQCQNAYAIIWGSSIADGMVQKLGRAYEKYKMQRKYRFEQAKDESDIRNNLPANFSRNDKYHDKGVTLDIHTLCCLDLMVNGNYSILDAIGYWDKDEYPYVSKKRVALSIIDYCNFLEGLEHMYADSKRSTVNKIYIRKYVEACIVIGQLEGATGIQLRLELANHICKTGKYWDNTSFEMAGELWGRSANNMLRAILPNYYRQYHNSTRKRYAYQEPSYEILNYSKWFPLIGVPKNSLQGYILGLKQMFKRAIIGDALFLLNKFCNPVTQRNWEDTDFMDAAKFFHESYPIAPKYLEALQDIKEILDSNDKQKERFLSLFISMEPREFMHQ